MPVLSQCNTCSTWLKLLSLFVKYRVHIHRLWQTMKLLSTNRGRNLVFWYVRSLCSNFLIVRVILPWGRVIFHLVCLLWWSRDSWKNEEWNALSWQGAQPWRVSLTNHGTYQYTELHQISQGILISKIECFHRHTIKIKIKNHSVDKVKKLWYYGRWIKQTVL